MELIRNYFIPFKKLFVANFSLRSALGFAVSGVLLWLTFKSSGLEIQKLNLDATQWFFFAEACGCFIVAMYIQAIRAKAFWLNGNNTFADVKTFDSLIIGNFYSCVLPGNLGDGVRAWHFSKKERVGFTRSLAAVMVEKAIDAPPFILVVIVIFIIKQPAKSYITYALAYTVVAAFGVSITYVLMRTNRRLEKWILGIVLLFKKPGRFLLRLYWYAAQHLINLERRKLVFFYIITSIITYCLNILQFYLLMRCANIPEPVASGYSAIIATLCMMIIAIVPSAPSNIGVMHYGMYTVLIFVAEQYGIVPDKAALQNYALFAVFLHLSFVLPDIVLGIAVLVKERRAMFN